MHEIMHAYGSPVSELGAARPPSLSLDGDLVHFGGASDQGVHAVNPPSRLREREREREYYTFPATQADAGAQVIWLPFQGLRLRDNAGSHGACGYLPPATGGIPFIISCHPGSEMFLPLCMLCQSRKFHTLSLNWI